LKRYGLLAVLHFLPPLSECEVSLPDWGRAMKRILALLTFGQFISLRIIVLCQDQENVICRYLTLEKRPASDLAFVAGFSLLDESRQ
jgi:hypothetical protein